MKTFYTVINSIIFFSYWLIILCITIRILIKHRATAPTVMSWLLAIYIIPFIGIIAYILLGELNIGKKRTERGKAIWLACIDKWIDNKKKYKNNYTIKYSKVAKHIFNLCKYRQGIDGLTGNNIQLLTNTNDTMKSIIRDIDMASKSIDIVFYIWQIGGIVDKVAESLIAAARRGVYCRLMLDSTGSINFFRTDYPAMMKAAGINVVEALHVNILRIFFRRIDLRQHRKMVLIDNYISYIGSMNMVDPLFFKKNAGVGQWIDIMARIEGSVTTAMSLIYACDWEIETGEHIIQNNYNKSIFSLEENKKKLCYTYAVQVIASGPGFPEGVIHQALLTSIYAAHEQLIITTPYFVPSHDLLHAICTAAQRGVKVHIIIPHDNDSILVNWASRAFLTELLDSGVFIHQFKGGFLHTKSVLVDRQLSLIGTVNIDMRSIWINCEITIIIDNSKFGNILRRIQEDYMSSSQIIDAITWSKRPYWQRIIERIFYFFSPLL